MPEYKKYPGVDETNNFPPPVRAAFAKSKEFVDGLAPKVSEALAADPTIKSAANTAISSEVTERNLVGTSLTAEEDVIFGITDEDDRRTWLEVGPDGGPSNYSAGFIGIADLSTEANDIVYAVSDEDGRRTDIEINSAGKITERVMASWRTRMGLSPIVKDHRIICSGDSMTGGSDGAYPQMLAANTGWEVLNYGSGGERSTTIAGRMGGRPMLGRFPGGVIPADKTAVAIELTSDTALAGGGLGDTTVKPLEQAWTGFHPVTIAGVEGSMGINKTVTPATYTFTRSTAGAEVPVNYWTPLHPWSSKQFKGSIHVLWWGHNDGATGANGFYDPTDIIARKKALIETLVGPNPRYLVIGVTHNDGNWRNGGHAKRQYLREFGRRYIALDEYLMSDASFQDAGITKTAEDVTDISNGWVPRSYRIDGIHYNALGNNLTAKLVEKRIREMGWL